MTKYGIHHVADDFFYVETLLYAFEVNEYTDSKLPVYDTKEQAFDEAVRQASELDYRLYVDRYNTRGGVKFDLLFCSRSYVNLRSREPSYSFTGPHASVAAALAYIENTKAMLKHP